MTIGERINIRTGETISAALLSEIVTLACDRIMMRVGLALFDENEERIALPKSLESIAVEVGIRIYRKNNFEGIASESADTLNTSFVDDVLSEFTEELNAYKRNTTRTVRFI